MTVQGLITPPDVMLPSSIVYHSLSYLDAPLTFLPSSPPSVILVPLSYHSGLLSPSFQQKPESSKVINCIGIIIYGRTIGVRWIVGIALLHTKHYCTRLMGLAFARMTA